MEMGITNRLQEIPEMFDRYRPAIEGVIRRVTQGNDGLLYRMMRYHLGFEDEEGIPQNKEIGKAFRPTLCLFACEAAGGDWQHALPAAAAIELVHNFSLIHDDIQDKDDFRRHRPTVWYLWGYPQGINAGDGMRELANSILFDLEKMGVAQKKILTAFRILNDSSSEMISGQTLDLSFESRLDVTVNDYLDMIGKKTGSLIECSFHMGALLGTDDQNCISAFSKCGRILGLAFQVRDDILGVWGDESATGKSSATDIRRKKKSLPIVYALEGSTGEVRSELTRLYGLKQLDDHDVASVLSILDELGAKAYAQGIVEEKCSQALSNLTDIKLSQWDQEEIKKLSAFLLNRER